MEIILLMAVGLFALWFFFVRPMNSEKNDSSHPLDSVTKPKDSVTVEGAGSVNLPTPVPAGDIAPQPAWHTAPPKETKPVTVESVAVAALDVNHDGKVNLDDVKEAVKKVRKPRAPKVGEAAAKTAKAADKATTKKAAPKKAAAIKPARKPRSKKV